MFCARAGDCMKKVSCASRAGCCCGWKRESKFQKELSTHLFVGISSKPINNSICRISCFTFIRGCRCPPWHGIPLTFVKLMALKDSAAQVPLLHISAVMAVSFFLTSVEKPSVGVVRKEVVFTSCTNLRFFSWSIRSLARLGNATKSACVASVIDCVAAVTCFDCLSTWIHLFFMATLKPIFATSPRAASMSEFWEELCREDRKLNT
mmetsp:Transcript_1412/g.3780  ORF Transcript_1412/g.3780 Transcript_1412/m.3780 type:complete len:207 (-) Transcript_1412:285-905(-)